MSLQNKPLMWIIFQSKVGSHNICARQPINSRTIYVFPHSYIQKYITVISRTNTFYSYIYMDNTYDPLCMQVWVYAHSCCIKQVNMRMFIIQHVFNVNNIHRLTAAIILILSCTALSKAFYQIYHSVSYALLHNQPIYSLQRLLSLH